MRYFSAVHKGSVKDLLGDKYDAMNKHMVFHNSYDLPSFQEFIGPKKNMVIIEMERCPEAKFGWSFSKVVTE